MNEELFQNKIKFKMKKIEEEAQKLKDKERRLLKQEIKLKKMEKVMFESNKENQILYSN